MGRAWRRARTVGLYSSPSHARRQSRAPQLDSQKKGLKTADDGIITESYELQLYDIRSIKHQLYPPLGFMGLKRAQPQAQAPTKVRCDTVSLDGSRHYRREACDRLYPQGACTNIVTPSPRVCNAYVIIRMIDRAVLYGDALSLVSLRPTGPRTFSPMLALALPRAQPARAQSLKRRRRDSRLLGACAPTSFPKCLLARLPRRQ